MITLFTIPKAFTGHIGVIQRNAIRSWTRLTGCEVILFGEEEGLREAAAELGVRHVPVIQRNDHGTPMVSDAFEQIRLLASTPLVAYVNTDIIFDDSLILAVRALRASSLTAWLLVGQRHDLDITQPMDFSDGWPARLRSDVARLGVPHGKAGIDYFVFAREFPLKLPDFAVGRPGWDSWLIYMARARGLHLVDGSACVLAVHQNHPPAYRPFGTEARANASAAGGYYRMGTLRDADWRLVRDKAGQLVLRPSYLGRLLFMPPARMLLAAKRYAQSGFGH